MIHYKVVIYFTAIVEENFRYFPKDFYHEVFVDLPTNVIVPRNRIFGDVLPCPGRPKYNEIKL